MEYARADAEAHIAAIARVNIPVVAKVRTESHGQQHLAKFGFPRHILEPGFAKRYSQQVYLNAIASVSPKLQQGWCALKGCSTHYLHTFKAGSPYNPQPLAALFSPWPWKGVQMSKSG